jgi:hypothetical protein
MNPSFDYYRKPVRVINRGQPQFCCFSTLIYFITPLVFIQLRTGSHRFLLPFSKRTKLVINLPVIGVYRHQR